MKTIDDVNLGVVVIENEDRDDETKKTVPVEDADFYRCPVCDSPNITYGDCEPESLFIYRVHACDECATTWEERYDLVQVKIENGKFKTPKELK